MKVLDLLNEASSAKPARPDRPSTTIIYDSSDVRLVLFCIAPGQQVAPHRSTSTVMLTAVQGSGVFTHPAGERAVDAGGYVVYEPNEMHGMRASDTTLVVLATITPRPGARAPASLVANRPVQPRGQSVRSGGYEE